MALRPVLRQSLQNDATPPRELAAQTRQFIERMSPPLSEQERIATELVDRVDRAREHDRER
ncbi:MAG TPA: hypothetical protein VGD54_17235 [Steroidobacteraceae bacterium]